MVPVQFILLCGPLKAKLALVEISHISHIKSSDNSIYYETDPLIVVIFSIGRNPQMLPLVHGRNPNHVREQGQRKWHFWISMVSAMSFFSEMVSCPDMNHKIAY